MRKGRPFVLGAALVLLALPALLAVAEAVSYRVVNRSNGSLVSSGTRREYLLYVPRGVDSTRPAPLVISLHGGAMWGAAQKETSQWNRVADEHGFIVVYPSAVGGHGPRAWEADGGPGQAGDVRFIAELIDTVAARYAIDRARVYANGLSNGGGMSFVLSCTLSDRIAAVGVVAPAIFLPWSACTDRRAVPMIAFHGTADRHTPYHGGPSWVARLGLPNIPRWTAAWARKNGCGPEPVVSVAAADVTRLEYVNCAEAAAVVLYTIHGGGHTWPGGTPLPEWFAGSTTNSIDASSEMWAFFREHPLRQAPSTARR